MTTEQLVAVIALLAAAALISTWAMQFQVRASRSPAPTVIEDETHDGAAPHNHVWLIAAREETAGKLRVISRCGECGAVEIREVM